MSVEINIKKMENPPIRQIETEDTDITNYYSNLEIGWKEQNEFESVIYECYVNNEVVGYVTASMNKIGEKISEVNHFVHPALLLGRMGVDKNHRKQGLGPKLIEYILGLAFTLKDRVGCRFVFLEVDKNRERLVKFYKEQGFEIAVNQPKLSKQEIYIMYFDLRAIDIS